MSIHFKKLLLIASIFSSSLVALLSGSASMAAAPMIKSPAPGYFRMMLGDFEVTALSDGTVNLPVDKLLNAPEEKTYQALNDVFLKAPLETSVNAYLVNTGKKLVLIDAGAGSLFGPTLGKLISNINAAGYEPGQIDDIFITHMHGDHMGGLVSNNQLNFPNAIVHADKRDVDFWLNQTNLEKAPEDQKGGYQAAMASINPYINAKKFSSFDGSTELVSGIKSYASYGHTAGHSVYVVESQGQKLLLIGDLIHVAAVQLDHPEVTIAFDSNQAEAAKTRDKVFSEAATQGVWVGASHIQFPGLGHLKKTGNSYEWVPVNFTQLN